MLKRPGGALLTVGVAGTLIHCCYVLFAPIGFLERYCVVDDTFYYWMIARRFWTDGFFTFDGINPTNGFQLLWQLLLLPFGLLAKNAQFRLSLLLGALFYQAAAWLLACWRHDDERYRAVFAIAAVALWTNARFVFEYASSGMEFGVYLFLAAWAAAEFSRLENSGRGGWVRFVTALALLPLARVDGIGLSFFFWLAAAVKFRSRGLGFHLVTGICACLLFGINCGWNYSFYGPHPAQTPFPVSGLVKRLDQDHILAQAGIGRGSGAWLLLGLKNTAVLFAANLLRFFGGWLPPADWPRLAVVAAGGASALAVLGLGIRARGDGLLRPPLFVAVPLVFLAVQASIYSFLIPWGTHYAQWYYGPAYLGLALLVGWVAAPVWREKLTWAAVGLMAAQLLCLVAVRQPTQIATEGLGGAIAHLESLDLPAGTRVGSWNAGLVAFRAPDQLHVVNLDGLVNSLDYATTYAVGRDKRGYLDRENIDYLVDYAVGREAEGWREMLVRRLYSEDSEAWRGFRALHVGPKPPADSPEPRRYHVLARIGGAEDSGD